MAKPMAIDELIRAIEKMKHGNASITEVNCAICMMNRLTNISRVNSSEIALGASLDIPLSE